MDEYFIRTEHLCCNYRDENGREAPALIDINLKIKKGEYIAVIGRNGSGKSTLAKLLNMILLPASGKIYIDGKDMTSGNLSDDEILDIRRRVGMVFQNPDNQIIGQVVEEDVGFGPENMGVPTEEIWKRVEESLKAVSMYDYRKKSPNRLSGGQKQRVCIAGVIAMHPRCIVMDEPTAMLDPSGRADVIRAALDLNRNEGITVILITHYMEEAIQADHIFVMDKGKVTMQGSPREVFSRVEEMQALHLDVPQVTLLAHRLRQSGLAIPEGILTKEELAEALRRCRQ